MRTIYVALVACLLATAAGDAARDLVNLANIRPQVMKSRAQDTQDPVVEALIAAGVDALASWPSSVTRRDSASPSWPVPHRECAPVFPS
jgi:hypothetical protein